MFTIVVFIITQARIHQQKNGRKIMAHSYNRILFSKKKTCKFQQLVRTKVNSEGKNVEKKPSTRHKIYDSTHIKPMMRIKIC